ncbi:MAG: glycosyltransferase family 2 protein [Deltaproteobacteria bacterium]|nr:MAG: glycosyltransferase family 2 protein [Deltaproteobacteria bacterium]
MLFYYGFVNLIYTALLLVSVVVTLRHIRRIRYSPFKDFVSSPETPPVSILVPAYNEERIIVRTVRSTLSVNYPFFEVIVVNDGSTDATLDTLIRTFNLRKVDRAYRNVLKTMPVRGFYYNPDVPKLLVVDKGNSGKADSLNCGINISRSPYFCTVDADSVLEENALIKLMTPTVESTVPVVACGGVIRALNGIHLEDGAVRHIDLPRSTLAMFQIVEYLRAFLFGRVGLNAMNGILILSGAFSLFRKASVVEAGGYRVENVTEDMELIIRLHRRAIDRKTPYSVKFISDPVCWTEVPEDLKMLGRQRRRWHLGLMQSMIQNRSALFNPRYGKFGWVVLPYYLFIELLSPVVELIGYVVVVLSYLFGMLSFEFMFLFLAMAVLYGIFLSTASIFLEEITYRRYPRWGHLFRLLFYGVIENFGYRQINSFWRCQAFLKYLVGMRKWEYVEKGKNVLRGKRQS